MFHFIYYRYVLRPFYCFCVTVIIVKYFKVGVNLKLVLSKEQKQDIVKLYQEGKTTKEIAYIYGCRYETVCKIVKKAGVSNKNGKRYSDDVEQQILSEYNSGKTMRNIALKYNISDATVCNILIRNGYEKKQGLLAGKEAEIICLYNSGKTTEELSNIYDCGVNTVNRLLKKEGVPLRTLRKFTDSQELVICKEYLEGNTLLELSKRYNCSDTAVYKILLRNKVQIRSNQLSDFDKSEIIKQYQLGISLTSLSEEFKTSHNTIKKVLQEYNIPLRTLSEANRVYGLNESYFDVIDTPDKAYFLGLLYADGNVYYNTVTIGLEEKDKHILEVFTNRLDTNKPLEWRDKFTHINKIKGNSKYYISKPQWIFRITNEHLAQSLIKLGCVSRKSLILKFPTKEQVPDKFMSDFIRGYFDGDGWVTFEQRKKSFKIQVGMIGTREFISGVKDYLHSKGIKNISFYKVSKEDKNTWVLLICSISDVLRFEDVIYYSYFKENPDGVLFLYRKWYKFTKFNKLLLNKPEIMAGVKKRRLTDKPEFISTIIDMYVNKKFSTLEISKKFNLSPTTVSNKLKKHGVKIISNQSKHGVLLSNISDIINSYQKGESVYSLSKRYNIDRGAISRLLKNNNIKQ